MINNNDYYCIPRWPKTEPHALTCFVAFAYARVPQSLVLRRLREHLFLETEVI